MNETTVLTARHLRKEFRVLSSTRVGKETFVAVDDVSFELAAGGSLAIVGESGSGKSTCARMVMGLERPTAGTIDLAGVPDGEGPGRRRRARQIQMVFQDPYSSLDPRQTVEAALAECVKLHFSLGTKELHARVRSLVRDVGLDERHLAVTPRGMSGGERQRVAIAKSLAAQPQVLVLDEAVAALDVSIQAQILNLLARIRTEQGIALLFISHDLAVVEEVCDDVVVMLQGSIVERGPVHEVLRDPQHPYTKRLIDSVPRPGWIPRRHVIAASREGV
ncbi:ABC transporter ATP-binding protein [Microbacterium sp. LWH3-1.2]|uniref:ABC transporter ATP-binding protein n=1 Tax=Microbacterium sp. LWH3-1.2 TaxID=3135256 RepID=UPI0034132FB5